MKYFLILSLLAFNIKAQTSTESIETNVTKNPKGKALGTPSKDNPFRELKSPLLTGNKKVKSTHLEIKKKSKKKKQK